MSYTNFIPTVWEVGINRDLERALVFAKDCYRKYEGKIKENGESVKIVGIGSPTITERTRKDRNVALPSAEELEDSSIIMPINRIAIYNYKVGDIDKAASIEGISPAMREETAQKLGNVMDKYIADLAKSTELVKLYSASTKVVAGTPAQGEVDILDALDEAKEKLMLNDVPDSTKIVATVSPKFYRRLLRANVLIDTDNTALLKNGYVGTYNKMIVRVSNNCANDGSGNESLMVRTNKAIAFAKPLTHVEAYRPEGAFADAVKGFILYDAKIIRPKEIIVMNVKYS